MPPEQLVARKSGPLAFTGRGTFLPPPNPSEHHLGEAGEGHTPSQEEYEVLGQSRQSLGEVLGTTWFMEKCF